MLALPFLTGKCGIVVLDFFGDPGMDTSELAVHFVWIRSGPVSGSLFVQSTNLRHWL